MTRNKKHKPHNGDTLVDGFNIMLSETEVNMYPDTPESKKIPLPFQKRDRIPRTPTQLSTASSLANLEDGYINRYDKKHDNNNFDSYHDKDQYNRSEGSEHSEGRYVEELEEEDEIEAFDGDDEKENENAKNSAHDAFEDSSSTKQSHLPSSKPYSSIFGKSRRTSMANNIHGSKPSAASYGYASSTMDDLDHEDTLAHKCRCTVM